QAKHARDPAPPSLLARDVPRDLESLCLDLLARDPAARPAERDILAALGVELDEWSRAAFGRSWSRAPFVGRAHELTQLHGAYARSRGGRAVAALLQGESGVGKSALAAQLVVELKAREPKLVVLSGRCHEQERVPYNAFDALVDDLARFLARRERARV